MSNQNKEGENQQPKGNITDNSNITPETKEVDAIKTGSKKRVRYYDKPFDEQMHESFNDIREQEGLNDQEFR